MLSILNWTTNSGLESLGAGVIALIVVVSIWELVWKLLAMWKAAQKKSPIWFVILMIFNTAGILSILYFYIFSEIKWKKERKNLVGRKRRKK